jgi:hypothetical protein
MAKASATVSTSRFRSPPALFNSKVEEAVINSKEPIKSNETHQITANKEKGLWLNRCETCNWKGDVPLSEYPINDDPCPHVIKKKSKKIDQTQKITIKYLKPPTPPAPGPIIVKKEPNKLTAPAPPLVIRQEPARPITPPVLVIREQPPPPPPRVPTKVITIPGKTLPAPPRKVIIERMAPEPQKPQTVIIERWLPYPTPKRKVIYQKSDSLPACPSSPNKNMIIQWEPSDIFLHKDIESLGIHNVDPCDYASLYNGMMMPLTEIPIEFKNLQPTHDSAEQASRNKSPTHELVGDIEALKLIDLDAEGLGMYKNLVKSTSTLQGPPNKELERSASFSFNNELFSRRTAMPSVVCITTCNSPFGDEFYKRYDFVDSYSQEYFF